MNKINRVVWSDEKQCFVVASEWAHSHKKSGAANLSRAVMGALLVGGFATAAIAGPGTPIKGSADGSIHYFSVDDGGTNGINYDNDAAIGAKAIAVGVNASAVNDSAVAVGSDTTASGDSSIAIGSNAKSEGSMGTAIGASAKALLDNATAVGTSAAASAKNSTALGFSANANGKNSLAAGYNATASLDNTTALGYSASAKIDDGVALGSNSVASTAAGIAGYVPSAATAAQQQAIANTKSTLAAVSVGDAATKRFRQITGVAAGKADSDAVNVAQLKGATADAVLYDDSTHNSVTLGGTTYNPSTKAGGTKITNVANGVAPSDAVNKSQLDDLASTPLTFTGNTGTVQKKLGDTVSIQGKGTASGSYVGDNLRTEVDANGVLQVEMTDKPVFTSVTTGNTTVDTHGVVIAGGPSITTNGIDAGSTKITNVAAGDISDASTDAINGSQLKKVQDAANAGWNATDVDGQTANIGPNGKVTFKGDSNVTVSQTGTDNDGQVEVNLNKDLNLGDTGSLTTGNTVVNNNGLTIAGGPSITTNGIDAGSKKISNVAAGDVSDTSTDAINGSQLKKVQDAANAGWNATDVDGQTANIGPNGKVTFKGDSNVTVSQTGTDNDGQVEVNLNKDLNLGDTGSLTTGNTVVNNNGLTIAGGPSITTNGIDAGSKKISNVAAGDVSDTSTDAINGSQLKKVQDAANAGWNATDADGHTANIGPNGKVTFKGDSNVTVSQTGTDNDGQVEVNLNKDLNLGDTGSLTTGNTVVNNNGLTIAGGPSVTTNGIDAGSKKITNVATGDISDASTDAINGSQLKKVQDAANAGWNATDADGHTANIGPNGKVTFKGDSNVTVSQTGTDNDGQVEVNLNKDLDLGDTGSLTTGNTVVNNNGLTIAGGPSITTNGIDAGSKKISNVAAGDISDASTDAINGSQLKKVQDAANAGWNATDADGHTANIGPNGKVTFKGDSNVTVSQTGTDNDGQVEVNLNKDLDLGDTGSVTAGKTVVNNDGVTITGGPSITVNGIDAGGTTITNVAAGTAPSDAVNVSQLYTAVDGVKSHYYSVNDNGTPGDNYNNDGAVGANAVAAGVGAVAMGTSATAFGNNAQANNDGDVALGAGSITSSSHAVASATLGGVTYQFAGANPTSVVSVGSLGNERQVTNVAAGQLSADSTDAVNGSQLYATNLAVDAMSSTIYGGGGIKYFHANSSLADSQAIGGNSIAVGPMAVSAGTDSVAIGNGATAGNDNSVALGAGSATAAAKGTSGATIAGDNYTFAGTDPTGTVSVGAAGQERTITNVAAGVLSSDSTDAVNGSQLYATNQAVDQLDGRVTNVENAINNISNVAAGQAGMFQTSADKAIPAPSPSGSNSAAGGAGAVASGDNSLALGNGAQAIANNSVAIGNDSVADRANSVSVGSIGNERQITNVAAGSQGTDAVNVSQLKAAQAGSVQYDSNSDGSTNYNSVTLNPSGGNATIHNVQAGSATTDAVNVGQLNDAMTNTQNWAKNYTDQQINQMGKRAYAGTAAAMATANVPQAYQPNQSSVGVGIGNYHGQSAISVGMSTITESGRYILKASATGSQQDGFGVGVGAGMVW